MFQVFVYRNLVKALPWFDEVREKLEDPQYWGWFLRYKDAARRPMTPTGQLYHDFEQTPGERTPRHNADPSSEG